MGNIYITSAFPILTNHFLLYKKYSNIYRLNDVPEEYKDLFLKLILLFDIINLEKIDDIVNLAYEFISYLKDNNEYIHTENIYKLDYLFKSNFNVNIHDDRSMLGYSYTDVSYYINELEYDIENLFKYDAFEQHKVKFLCITIPKANIGNKEVYYEDNIKVYKNQIPKFTSFSGRVVLLFTTFQSKLNFRILREIIMEGYSNIKGNNFIESEDENFREIYDYKTLSIYESLVSIPSLIDFYFSSNFIYQRIMEIIKDLVLLIDRIIDKNSHTFNVIDYVLLKKFNLFEIYNATYGIDESNFDKSFFTSEKALKEYLISTGVYRKEELEFIDNNIDLIWDNITSAGYIYDRDILKFLSRIDERVKGDKLTEEDYQVMKLLNELYILSNTYSEQINYSFEFYKSNLYKNSFNYDKLIKSKHYKLISNYYLDFEKLIKEFVALAILSDALYVNFFNPYFQIILYFDGIVNMEKLKYVEQYSKYLTSEFYIPYNHLMFFTTMAKIIEKISK